MAGAALGVEALPLATTVNAPGPAADRPGAQPARDGTSDAPRAAGAVAARRGLLVVGALLAIFLLAFAPRWIDLDRHATADEDLTLIRSANVALALERSDWWGTYQIGHPEATVQLLVALGLGPDALRPYAGDFLGPDARLAAGTPGYLDTLVSARRLLVPVHAAVIALAALLACRLWGGAVGLVAGALLALEPFLVAHGRILRTDALLAELMLVAVLAGLAYWSGRAGLWALAACIVATGLALLTKTPALALLGAIPGAAFASAHVAFADRISRERATDSETGSADGVVLGRRLRALAGVALGLLTWLIGSVALAFALWPALWARPLRALERMAVYTQEKGGSPMDAGSFFLGTPIPDPGPLYYAVALPLRLSPVILLGLALWLALRSPGFRQGVGMVLLVGLGLAAVLAFLPKKADRYILPAIPFLVVVAAVGLAALAARWRRAAAPVLVLVLVVVVETALLAAAWPYPLAAYNPLLGGGPAAARAISVGWGEGLDQLAPILNRLPGAEWLTVSTPYPEVLQAQIAGRAVDLDAYDRADYVVTYVAASQRQLTDPALDAVLAGRKPLASVEIAGVPYAELYALDPAGFEGGLQARQLDVSPEVVARRGWVTVRLALHRADAGTAGAGSAATAGTPPASYEVEVVLLDAGKLVDVDASMMKSIPADGQVQEIKLRAPSQGGRYAVGLSLRDPRDGRLLPVSTWPVGAPQPPDRLVFPSLGVRVQ